MSRTNSPPLQIRLSGKRSRPIPLREDPVSIGRHPDNYVRIKDESSSRHHAIILLESQGVHIIRDLGSRNGTRVNGQLLTRDRVLKLNDHIEIGKFTFQVEPRVVPVPAERVDTSAAVDDTSVDVPKKRRRGDTEPAIGPWLDEVRAMITAVSLPGSPRPEHKGSDLKDASSFVDVLSLVDASGATSDALTQDSPGPVAVRHLLTLASRARATDLHFEPRDGTTNVRMRVDGQMVWVTEMPQRIGELVGGLIKGVCRLPSAAKDAVQDGHFSARFPARRVEYRASFTPAVGGQTLVLRVLDQVGVPTSLGDLGMVHYMQDRIREVCSQDAGLILVCGPTGSGKTTTLYNALREIDREARKVVAIEDPVEYRLEGVTQLPIDERRGNTFSTLLRSVLRQDPDAIMLGEIRDEDTARTAMRAAMTGHLVFTTVHARDSISAVFRLLDLGVESYLVANALTLVLAQRLVRTLCMRCRCELPITSGITRKMGKHLDTAAGNAKVYQPVGCAACLDTGYRGRHALFELLNADDELRDAILTSPSIQDMRRIVRQGVFTSLTEFGYRLVAQGKTSLEEVDRVSS